MTGAGKLDLWCRKCRRILPHVNMEWGVEKSTIGRLVHGTCSVCGYRDRTGYVIYEEEK